MSKAYGVIRRFSEDVDLTYDNRAIGCDAAAYLQGVEFPSAVADHKSVFFAEKNTHGDAIDYQHMVDDGLFLDDAEPFKALMERCQAIQQKANAKQPPQWNSIDIHRVSDTVFDEYRHTLCHMALNRPSGT